MDYPTLEEALDEIGITARVEKREKVQIAEKLVQKGWDSAEIAETTGLDLSTVESLIGAARA